MPVFLMLWKISPHVSDPIIYAIIGLFVPLLWFLVGRWLDGVLGLLPAKPQRKAISAGGAGICKLSGDRWLCGFYDGE